MCMRGRRERRGCVVIPRAARPLPCLAPERSIAPGISGAPWEKSKREERSDQLARSDDTYPVHCSRSVIRTLLITVRLQLREMRQAVRRRGGARTRLRIVLDLATILDRVIGKALTSMVTSLKAPARCSSMLPSARAVFKHPTRRLDCLTRELARMVAQIWQAPTNHRSGHP